MASSRTVGKGRGAVYADGRVYLEGATVPDGVKVGDHVFDDVDPVEGNVTVEMVRPLGPGGPVVEEPGAAQVPAESMTETPAGDSESGSALVPPAKKTPAKGRSRKAKAASSSS